MSSWTLKARKHAARLRGLGMSPAEIGALMGRSSRSVGQALAAMDRETIRKSKPTSAKDRLCYNRVEIASMLGLAIDEFMRQRPTLEKERGMPPSHRAKYAVSRVLFDAWLKKTYYPNLTLEEWVWQARGAFLKACGDRRPDNEINRAARILRAAESVLLQRG